MLFISALPAIAQAKPLLSVAAEDSAEVITLAVGNISSHKVFFLGNPDRLVVDVPMEKIPAIALPKNYGGNLIAKVRAGQFDANTVRIVFDLRTPVTLVTKDYADGELIISISAGGKNAPPPKPEKPLVVIDPGHGGNDPGAIGPKKSQEKDIVLAFATSLKDMLLASGKYRVLMTRESDRFIPLRERVKIAREAKGSIFISIHADSAPKNNARGLSVYTLSEKASDAETAALAANENKVDILGGMDLSNEREDVADILISLAQRETRNRSALLADLLTVSLGKQLKLLPNPHRFAGFAVLKAPDIPSVLIETGFISNPAEEKLLKTSAYRKKLMVGIMGGIDRYFEAQSPSR
ncbi:MAG: N-acetylmuramoyl-L-alanine amidase [Alphaproteobacteria bacterium]|nr:N-acetylmuramoyl-L-alanine amidase [Alphaproteobacteria bacterium]